jgi:hypothetical protein
MLWVLALLVPYWHRLILPEYILLLLLVALMELVIVLLMALLPRRCCLGIHSRWYRSGGGKTYL